jgi:CHAT domain-containing protein
MSDDQTRHQQRLDRRSRYLEELESLWNSIIHENAESGDYVAMRRGDPMDWHDLSRLATRVGKKTAILSLNVTADRTLLFILRDGWREPKLVEADLSQQAWGDLVGRLQQQVHRHRRADGSEETWDRALHPLLAEASTYLAGAEHIVCSLRGSAHLIPWSAVAWRAGLRTLDGKPIAFTIVPALGVLHRLLERPTLTGTGVLVVGDPSEDLEHAEREARHIGAVLDAEPLIGRGASKQAVLNRLSHASIVHLATHAHFSAESPLGSGILLADGILTAREVVTQRLHADLLVLSACQTGLAGALAGDELAGLAHAFLHAGARSVLVSLWEVNDPATQALMSAFYAAQQSGANKAMALTQAMAAIRVQRQWSHSYYWGPFVLMGDWN